MGEVQGRPRRSRAVLRALRGLGACLLWLAAALVGSWLAVNIGYRLGGLLG